MNDYIPEDKSFDSDSRSLTTTKRSQYRRQSSLSWLNNLKLKKKKFKKPTFEVQRPENTYITIEHALEYTGDNSKYSKRILYFILFYWIWYSFLVMGMPLFIGGKVDYLCYDDTTDNYLSCAKVEACSLINKSNLRLSNTKTITEDFMLVCDRAYMAAWIGSVIYFSNIVSSLVFSEIADLHGRKKVIILCGLIASISLIITSVLTNFTLWVIFIFLAGFGFGGLEVICRVYLSEISAKNFRVNSTTALNIVWAGSQVLLGFILLIVQDWRQVFFYLMGILFLIFVILGAFYFDESPKYLVYKERTEEAKQILKKITRINKRPPFEFKLMKELQKKNEK